MNTPTETPTPNVEGHIRYRFIYKHEAGEDECIEETRDAAIEMREIFGEGNEEIEEIVVPFSQEEKLQIELAAVTKERDDAVAKGENITHQLGMAMMELTEANTDRARLREALGQAQTFVASAIPMTTVRSGVVHNDRALVECELTMVRQLQADLEAALSTPPPPVVPIMDLFAKMARELTHSGYIWNESIERLKELAAKHPTSNLTSRGDVAG
jgi:hypothetical protein